MELIFATNNQHKLAEIKAILSPAHHVIGLSEQGINEEIPETHDTLEGNAIEKAMYIYQKYGLSCFADDTGLEVESLDGRPGVYSARYAGEACSFSDNVNKLLSEMDGHTNRKACFRTIIALVGPDGIQTFEGKVDGVITTEPSGNKGFGYDPVFQPLGYAQTFADMPATEKNKISHRARAIEKFVAFLQ